MRLKILIEIFVSRKLFFATTSNQSYNQLQLTTEKANSRNAYECYI